MVLKFEPPNARVLNFPKNSALSLIRLVLINGDCVNLFVKKKVFNYSELHFSEATSYKIHTLTGKIKVFGSQIMEERVASLFLEINTQMT